jgi:hypothetical protein
MSTEWFDQWDVKRVVQDAGVDGWWNSTREVTVVEKAVKAKRNEAQQTLAKGVRGSMRDTLIAFDKAAESAIVELKERKRQLSLTDSLGDAWKSLFVSAFRRDYGDEAFDRINAEVQAILEERTKLRSVPMSAGSVLAPIGGSGAMKQR